VQLASAQRGARRRRPKPHLIRRRDEIVISILDPDQFRVLRHDGVGSAERGLNRRIRIRSRKLSTSLPRSESRPQALPALLIPSTLSALSANEENDDHDHQQQAKPATEQMKWRPQIEPAAAEKENKENQKQN
jgi:hypothetical protein